MGTIRLGTIKSNKGFKILKPRYRISAYWLRLKCSIYELGEEFGAFSILSKGLLGIALTSEIISTPYKKQYPAIQQGTLLSRRHFAFLLRIIQIFYRGGIRRFYDGLYTNQWSVFLLP